MTPEPPQTPQEAETTTDSLDKIGKDTQQMVREFMQQVMQSKEQANQLQHEMNELLQRTTQRKDYLKQLYQEMVQQIYSLAGEDSTASTQDPNLVEMATPDQPEGQESSSSKVSNDDASTSSNQMIE